MHCIYQQSWNCNEERSIYSWWHCSMTIILVRWQTDHTIPWVFKHKIGSWRYNIWYDTESEWNSQPCADMQSEIKRVGMIITDKWSTWIVHPLIILILGTVKKSDRDLELKSTTPSQPTKACNRGHKTRRESAIQLTQMTQPNPKLLFDKWMVLTHQSLSLNLHHRGETHKNEKPKFYS